MRSMVEGAFERSPSPPARFARHLPRTAGEEPRPSRERDLDTSEPKRNALRLLLYLFRRGETVQYLRAG